MDGVIKQVVDMLKTDMQSYLENGKILRFGYVRDDELSKNPYATSFNYTLSKCDSYARQLEYLMTKRDELRANPMIMRIFQNNGKSIVLAQKMRHFRSLLLMMKLHGMDCLRLSGSSRWTRLLP